MPAQLPFISYAQNREDVVLWRALSQVTPGRYVEVGANHPSHHSVSRAFYDRGWSGLTIEPVPYFADLHRKERPRDTMVQAAVTERGDGEIILHLIPGTGLSTTVDSISEYHEAAGYAHEDVAVRAARLDAVLQENGWSESDDIHFLLVDVEGGEPDVLRSIDLRRWRPWVLVIEATEPLSTRSSHEQWEPDVLAAGYRFCLFDGLSRFYVAEEKADELGRALSYPACVLDDFQPQDQIETMETANELLLQATHWRTVALRGWADAVGQRQAGDETEALRRELDAMRHTLSWRVTSPLRGVRRLLAQQVRDR